MLSALPRLDPAAHVPHALHRGAGSFAESNCYADLWIELLHALELDPHAMLAHVLAVDFEGDQWTFFKPPGEDLRSLYGIDVQELQIWSGFAGHVFEQLRRGRVVLAEVDAFHLPDTAGTSHRLSHVKTTIGIERVDFDAGELGYFHNSGYHRLEGADFAGVFESLPALPPYVEFAKLERLKRLPPSDLRRKSRALLASHLERAPKRNPIIAQEQQFEAQIRNFMGDLERFHAYSFASLRQCGAAWELGAHYVRWLFPDDREAAAAAAELELIAGAAKSTILQLARATMRNKPRDLKLLVAVAPSWDAAMEQLSSCLTRHEKAA
jgi:Domain of unknown function (DUF1839)